MKKIFLNLLFILGIILTTNAQTKFGIIGGLNFATMHSQFSQVSQFNSQTGFDPNQPSGEYFQNNIIGYNPYDPNVLYLDPGSSYTTPKSRTSIHVGFVLNQEIGNQLVFQPQVLFSGKGGKVTNGSVLALSYIEIPLNFMYKIPVGIGNISIGAGPYGGAVISAKAKASNGQETDLNIGSSDNSDIKALDYGVNFIGGFELPLGFFININYSFGLANLESGQISDEINTRNQSLGISIGCYFGGTKY